MSSFADGLIIPVLLFAVCVALVFTAVAADRIFASAPQLATFQPQVNQSINVLVSLLPLILIAFMIGAMISAFLIRTHPIFFVVTIILMILEAIITPIISNLWASIMTADPTIQTKALSFVVMITLMNNLPLITVVMSGVAALVGFLRGIEQ